ncbi:MAG TPA: hypothetical protein VF373_13210, partial [Prolixibacteraceae bacterium]
INKKVSQCQILNEAECCCKKGDDSRLEVMFVLAIIELLSKFLLKQMNSIQSFERTKRMTRQRVKLHKEKLNFTKSTDDIYSSGKVRLFILNLLTSILKKGLK